MILEEIAASYLMAFLAVIGTRVLDLYNLLTNLTFCLILISVGLTR